MNSSRTLSAPALPLAFRDTAATVADLSNRGKPVDVAEFRQKCDEQHEALRRELTSAGHLPDVVRDALYAQCALLDEAALGRLEGADRDGWEHEPLQVRKFQSNDAGVELISLIERRLAEPKPRVMLLCLFSAVLGLGFKGRFTLNGTDARMALMRDLDQRLGHGIDRDTTGTVVVSPNPARARIGALSPLGVIVAGCVVSGLVYLALGQWLGASIASMAQLAT
jgi:type VI secretion system protein ImpK